MNTKKIRILFLMIVGIFAVLIISGCSNDGPHLTQTAQAQSAALHFTESEYNCAGEVDLADDGKWMYEKTETPSVLSDSVAAAALNFSTESGLMDEYILNLIESNRGITTVDEAKDSAPFHIALPSVLPEGFDSSNAFASLSRDTFFDGEGSRQQGLNSAVTVTYLMIPDSLAYPRSVLTLQQRTSEPEFFGLKLDNYYRMASEFGIGNPDVTNVTRIEVNGLDAVLVTREDYPHASGTLIDTGRIFWHTDTDFFELRVVVPAGQFDLDMSISTAESVA